MRFTRAGVLDTLQQPFVTYQDAMGIPRAFIVWKYVLRNALTSTVTQIGLLFGILLAGAVVIETVFQWPGIGAYAFEAILQSDYAGVMGFTVYAGGVFMLVNLLVDIAHGIIDRERRRHDGSRTCCANSLRDRSALLGLILVAACRASCHPRSGDLATHPEAVWDMNPGIACCRRAEMVSRHRPHGRRHLQPRALRRPDHAGDRGRGGRRLAVDRRADRIVGGLERATGSAKP